MSIRQQCHEFPFCLSSVSSPVHKKNVHPAVVSVYYSISVRQVFQSCDVSGVMMRVPVYLCVYTLTAVTFELYQRLCVNLNYLYAGPRTWTSVACVRGKVTMPNWRKNTCNMPDVHDALCETGNLVSVRQVRCWFVTSWLRKQRACRMSVL